MIENSTNITNNSCIDSTVLSSKSQPKISSKSVEKTDFEDSSNIRKIPTKIGLKKSEFDTKSPSKTRQVESLKCRTSLDSMANASVVDVPTFANITPIRQGCLPSVKWKKKIFSEGKEGTFSKITVAGSSTSGLKLDFEQCSPGKRKLKINHNSNIKKKLKVGTSDCS